MAHGTLTESTDRRATEAAAHNRKTIQMADKIDIDLREAFGRKAELVQYYVDDYNLVIDLDEQLGDAAATGSAFMKEVAVSNPDAVAKANAIKEQLKSFSLVERAVIIHELTTDRELRKVLTDFVSANKPKEETPTLPDTEVARIWTERSDAQKRAINLHRMLSSGTLTADELALLPDPPEGKRGAAPGVKRGTMGRKLPAKVSWIIANEEHGVKSGADAAKLIGVKAADLRIAIEKAYPDATPDEFKVELNGKEVFGTVVDSTTVDNEPGEGDDDTLDTDNLDVEFDVEDPFNTDIDTNGED